MRPSGKLERETDVCSGTSIKENREWAPSATEALRLIGVLIKLRRPGVKVEGERGNPATFLQLKRWPRKRRVRNARRGLADLTMSAVVANNGPLRQGLGAVRYPGVRGRLCAGAACSWLMTGG